MGVLLKKRKAFLNSGREQRVIEDLGGAWSTKGAPNTRSGNSINGINKLKKPGLYLTAMVIQIGGVPKDWNSSITCEE